MKPCLSDRLRVVKARAALTVLLVAAATRAQAPPPPPPAAIDRSLPESVMLPSAKASEPTPEVDTIKVRLNGEYEARQSFLTNLPLTAVGEARPALGQT